VRFKYQRTIGGIDENHMPRSHFLAEDLARNRVLDLLLDQPKQRPCAITLIVAMFAQPFDLGPWPTF
jgi:hypothetical protein